MTYSEKLKDPRWQKKRLEVMKRDDFKCKLCNDETTTLQIQVNDNTILKFIYHNDGTEKTQNNILFAILEDRVERFDIACKVTTSQNEIDILWELHEQAMKNKTIHYPYIYCIIECTLNNLIHINNSAMDERIKLLNAPYKLILNQMAVGNLYKYFEDYISSFVTYEVLLDLLMQIFVCILTLHSDCYSHNDCNYGNFLYYYDDNIDDRYTYYIQYRIIYTNIDATIYMKIYNKCIWKIWDFETTKKESYNIIDMDYLTLKNDFIGYLFYEFNIDQKIRIQIIRNLPLLNTYNIVQFLSEQYKTRSKNSRIYNNKPYILHFK
jgi:hypothetical protein